VEELVPAAAHVTEQYSNNRIEADHGRLKARLRPMRGLKRLRSTAVIALGHCSVQNLRGGHYEFATDARPRLRLATASPNWLWRSDLHTRVSRRMPGPPERNRAGGAGRRRPHDRGLDPQPTLLGDHRPHGRCIPGRRAGASTDLLAE
jgi:hypothetical protein